MKNRFLCILCTVLFLASCTGGVKTPSPATPAPATAVPTRPATATLPPTSTSEEVVLPPTEAPLALELSPEGTLYEDNFTDRNSGWQSLAFDNSYIGYHEPEYYHVAVRSANEDELVPVPEGAFTDFTAEAEVFVELGDTAAEGDYRYGLAFRRSGDQFYAFTISPVTKKWAVLKHSPSGQEILQEGDSGTIGEPGEKIMMRVDARGPEFAFYINGQSVGQISDPDFNGEQVGFYVQTLDSPQVHIHYDRLLIREVQALQPGKALLYEDNFTDRNSGWQSLAFDNSYIGYHEPEYYHVAVRSANEDELVPVPEEAFTDFTAEAEVFVELGDTAAEGDYRYGLAFRRSGDQFYAFTISPKTQTWYALKSSPAGQEVVQEGDSGTIGEPGEKIQMRVDVRGSEFFFHLNDEFVGLLSDPDFSGEQVGFYVQTLDSPQVHIHYDRLAIREVETPALLCQVTAKALNLRTGPGTAYRLLTALLREARFQALGRTPDALWLRVRVEDGGQEGWLSNDRGLVSCSVPVEDLPVSEAPPRTGVYP